MKEMGRGIAAIGICAAIGFVFNQEKDPNILWWLFLILLLF